MANLLSKIDVCIVKQASGALKKYIYGVTGKLFFNYMVKNYMVSEEKDRFENLCPRSLDPFYMVSYYMSWVYISLTYRTKLEFSIFTIQTICVNLSLIK